MEEILRLFPLEMKQSIDLKVGKSWNNLQEIRFRLYKPIELIFDEKVEWLTSCLPKENDGVYLLNQLSEYSLYRMEDELREGYMTIQGGHRVGLAGKVNTKKGSVKAILHITFLNIRIAKEKVGVAEDLIPYIYDQHKYVNTLLIGPPQTGKTTIIRDISRIAASGYEDITPKKIGIIDERSEIAASIRGVPQHNVGLRTDVMDGCPKAEGMMMMIRSMSPEIIIVDEIGSANDVQALMESINAGVIVICTIHGKSLSELKRRPSLEPIFTQKVFNRFIILEKSHKPGQIGLIQDEYGNKLNNLR